MFNSEKAYNHTKNISFPRSTGSEGEKNARDYIKNFFDELSLKTDVQEFTYSTFPLSVMARLFLLSIVIIEVLIYLFYEKHPLISLSLCIFSVYLIISSTKWRKSYHFLYNIPWKLKTSWNIIAKKEVKNATKNLIFLAHYDSKSQTLPAFWRALSFGTSATGSVALVGLSVLFVIGRFLGWEFAGWDKTLLFYICSITIIAILFLQFNRSANKSPGALDNASGIGVLLELSDILPDKIKNTNLTFIATGAEEDGLCGAVKFMEEYESQYDRKNSFFINFDGPGADGKLIITSAYAVPAIHTGGLLTSLAFKIIEKNNYPAMKGYIPLGAGLDQFPISIYGFPVITISSGKIFSKIIFAIHSENDTLDLISTEALKKSGTLSFEMALEIDKYF